MRLREKQFDFIRINKIPKQILFALLLIENRIEKIMGTLIKCYFMLRLFIC